jgi:hypothetical protein
MDGHRHTQGPEHDFEPVPGLPEPLPTGERMLWQGSPDVRGLALHAFHVRKVAIYFAAIGAIQFASSLADGLSPREALAGLATLAALAAVAIGVLATVARLAARSTLYTVTDRRVVMRVGIVLTMTFNIPFARISAAGLKRYADGTGDLPLTLAGTQSIGYAHLWPHARPWRLRRPEPMLRCVPDAARVGALLADAWSQATGGAVRPAGVRVEGAAEPMHAPEAPRAPEGRAALAGR